MGSKNFLLNQIFTPTKTKQNKKKVKIVMCKYLSNQMDCVFISRKINKNYSSLSENLKKALYGEFLRNPYPKAQDLKSLSEKFHLSKDKIRNWFKYQRKKDYKTKRIMITKYKKNNSFSKENRSILESFFRKSPELDRETLMELSQRLECPEIFIKRWYYYRKKKLNSFVENKNSQQQTPILPLIPKVQERTKIEVISTNEIQPQDIRENVKEPIPGGEEVFKQGVMSYLSNFANYCAVVENLWRKQNLENQVAMLQQNSSFNSNLSIYLNLLSLRLRLNR